MTLAAAGCSRPSPASAGLLDAGGVQAGEGPLVALERLLVRAGAGNGGGQGVVGPVQHGDPLGPRRAPLAQLAGVGGAGPQEVPADMGPAPQRVHAVDAGQGLVGPVEVGGDDQAPAGLQRGLVKVDAQLAGGHPRRAGRVHHEHGRVRGDERPQPPAVVLLVRDVLEHLPGGLVAVRVPGLPGMGGDRLRPGCQQRRDLLQLAGQGAGRDVQPLGGQRGHDPVHRPAQHVLLVQQPGQEPGGEQPLRDHLGRRRRAGRRSARRTRSGAGSGGAAAGSGSA